MMSSDLTSWYLRKKLPRESEPEPTNKIIVRPSDYLPPLPQPDPQQQFFDSLLESERNKEAKLKQIFESQKNLEGLQENLAEKTRYLEEKTTTITKQQEEVSKKTEWIRQMEEADRHLAGVKTTLNIHK